MNHTQLDTQSTLPSAIESLTDRYLQVRAYTAELCQTLQAEDYVPQPMEEVSPPKWHLGHTTWFFERFILVPYLDKYKEFDASFNFIFNSYYEAAGERIARNNRGFLFRPPVEKVYEYRNYVDLHMRDFLASEAAGIKAQELVELGLQHEQQHQELLLTDTKYIFSTNPLYPAFRENALLPLEDKALQWINIPEGVYEIGHKGGGFCYDNELGVHKVYLHDCKIMNRPVTAGEFMEFIEAGGYGDYRHWHSEGWAWVCENSIEAPLYWRKAGNRWERFSMGGMTVVHPHEPLAHVSFYEACAYASWKGLRLPTEFEWEAAHDQLHYGQVWEWTNSAYLPYPGYKTPEGATGEYNGKFMVNQMVLRGASVATSPGHMRPTYRNFFHPDKRWQFSGFRLAKYGSN